MSIFNRKLKEIKPTIKVGDYLLGKVVEKINISPAMGSWITKSHQLKGTIQELKSGHIKINGEWYHIGSSEVGDLYIISFFEP
jgi:hypothetical protein